MFVLFDLDGTLVDSLAVLNKVFVDFLASHGVVPGVDDFAAFNGLSTYDVVAVARDRWRLSGEAAVLERQYLARVRASYEEVSETDGATAVLSRLRTAGVRLGIVTGAVEECAAPLIRRLDWRGLLDVVVFGERARPAKPDPLPYRRAVAELGFADRHGTAVEDSGHGIRSAIGAGLAGVGFAPAGDGDDLRAAGATRVIRHLSEL